MPKHGSPNVKKLIAKQRTKQFAKTPHARVLRHFIQTAVQAVRDRKRGK